MRIVLPTGLSPPNKFFATVWPNSATRVVERTSVSVKEKPKATGQERTSRYCGVVPNTLVFQLLGP